MRKLVIFVLVAGTIGGWSPPPAGGQTVGYTAEYGEGTAVYRITLETGDLELFPALGSAYGVALDPSGGLLYGVVPGPGDTPHLAVVELATLDQSDVGPLAGVGLNGGGLTFDAAGRLWVGDTLGRLFEVDPATAQTALVLDTGLRLVALTACGDRLLALVARSFPERGQLYEIRPDSALIAPIGPERTELGTSGAGLDFDTQGRLWAVLDRASLIPGPLPVDDIVELDPADGAVLSQLTVLKVGSSLAITPPAPRCPGETPVLEVPTLGTFHAIALAGLLAVYGCWFMLRQRFQSEHGA